MATITKRILIWGLAALFTAATVAADDSEPLNEHCHYEHVGFWGSEGAATANSTTPRASPSGPTVPFTWRTI